MSDSIIVPYTSTEGLVMVYSQLTNNEFDDLYDLMDDANREIIERERKIKTLESRIKELEKYIIDEDICCCDSQHQYTCMKCEILGEKK